MSFLVLPSGKELEAGKGPMLLFKVLQQSASGENGMAHVFLRSVFPKQFFTCHWMCTAPRRGRGNIWLQCPWRPSSILQKLKTIWNYHIFHSSPLDQAFPEVLSWCQWLERPKHELQLSTLSLILSGWRISEKLLQILSHSSSCSSFLKTSEKSRNGKHNVGISEIVKSKCPISWFSIQIYCIL